MLVYALLVSGGVLLVYALLVPGGVLQFYALLVCGPDLSSRVDYWSKLKISLILLYSPHNITNY